MGKKAKMEGIRNGRTGKDKYAEIYEAV